jgi:hypothetical protein
MACRSVFATAKILGGDFYFLRQALLRSALDIFSVGSASHLYLIYKDLMFYYKRNKQSPKRRWLLRPSVLKLVFKIVWVLLKLLDLG